MEQVIRITIGDKEFEISRDRVINTLRGASLGTVRKHAVVVDKVRHPVKKAFSAVTGVDVLDFNTVVARNAFARLGFEVVREI